MQKKLKKRIKRYKRMVGCTTEQATIAIQYEEYEKRNIRKATICPICDQYTLYKDSDGNEFAKQWVKCHNCFFEGDPDNYEPVHFWYLFDDLPKMGANLREYGFTKKEWKQYVWESTEEKRAELSVAGYLR